MTIHRSNRSALTLTMAAIGATLAIVSPSWRTALVAQTYYQGGMRMTGGGAIAKSGFHHDFMLHCDPTGSPNLFVVHWGSNRFHLDTLTEASCTDDPSIDSDSTAGFNTYDGAGTGTLNGVPATATWTFTDAGRPKKDFTEITITDESGNVITVSGLLRSGNHLAKGG
jgi:hypothetical protein